MLNKTQMSILVSTLMYYSVLHASPVLPTQGKVVHGKVNIASTTPSHLMVQQQSHKAIVNWQTFNVSKDAKVEFQQPHHTSSILNRVQQGSSEIAGQIQANGQVYLLNPNGIIFSPTSQVNTATLIAATGNMSDEAYLSGSGNIDLSSQGYLQHSGQITAAQGGKIVLASQNINSAVGSKINANAGEIDILAGKQLRVNVTVDGLIQTDLTEGVSDSKIIYQGDINAKASTVKVLARGENSKIEHEGTIEAHSILEKEGKIYLVAGYEKIGEQPKTGQLNINSTLDASAPQGGNGGFIETSAAQLNIDKKSFVTTTAVDGKTGNWLLDPYDIYITRSIDTANNNFNAQQNDTVIYADILETSLQNNNITVSTGQGGNQSGDIWINGNLTWDKNNLTLDAARNININAVMQVDDQASLSLNYGGKLKTQISGNNFVGKINFDKNTLPNQQALTINQNPYYLIKSANDFNDNTFGEYQYIGLAQDIDFKGLSNIQPIQNNALAFNGLGHQLSGVVLNESSTGQHVGLFSSTLVNSHISNLALNNLRTDFQNFNDYWAGSLVGVNEGHIDNVMSDVVVNDAMFFGGLVGYNAGTIENSYATVEAQGTYNLLGGLAALNQGEIRNSYTQLTVSDGNQVGGLASYNAEDALIENSYAKINFTTSNPQAGALVSENSGKIRNSYATGTMQNDVALVAVEGTTSQFENNYWLGQDNNIVNLQSNGVALTYDQSKNQSSYNWGAELIDGLGDSPWRIYENKSQPLLRNFLKPVEIDVEYAQPINLIQQTKESYLVDGKKIYDGSTNLPLEFSFLDTQLKNIGITEVASIVSPNVGAQTINLSSKLNNDEVYAQSGFDLPNITLTSNFIIEPKQLTIQAENAIKTYDGKAYNGGNGVTYAGFVNGETADILQGQITYQGNSQGAVNAGDYIIRPRGVNSQNYKITFVDGQLSIEKAPLTAKALDHTIKYQGQPYNGGNGVTYAGFVNGETEGILQGQITYQGNSQGAVNAGDYIIRPRGVNSQNYKITFVDGQLSIEKAPLTAKALDHTIKYQGQPYNGGNGVTYAGFVNGETEGILQGQVTYQGNSQGAVNAGDYIISPTGVNSQNYTITFIDGQLSIEKAPLTIKALDHTIKYQGQPYNGGNGVTYAGFVNGESFNVLQGQLAYRGTSQSAINKGNYTIIPVGFSSENYDITFREGRLTIENSHFAHEICKINGVCQSTTTPITLNPTLPALVSDLNYVALKECQMDDEDNAIPTDCILMNPDIVEAMPTTDDDDTPAQPIEMKRALIIANSNYVDEDIPSLAGVRNDQVAIRSVLEQQGYQVTVVEDGDRREMISALNTLIHQSGQNDSVLVYYAGHGDVATGSSVGYWLPTDASLDEPKEWLSTLDVAKFLKNIAAKQILLVSDSCFSGSLSYETALQPDTTLSENAILKRRSVMVMTSGSEEFVQDMAPNGLSPFANAFIDTIRQNNIAVLPGQSIYKQVHHQITSKYKQHPTYGALVTAGHMNGGEYLFKRH